MTCDQGLDALLARTAIPPVQPTRTNTPITQLHHQRTHSHSRHPSGIPAIPSDKLRHRKTLSSDGKVPSSDPFVHANHAFDDQHDQDKTNKTLEQEQVRPRIPSLTAAEMFFLRALLLDDNPDGTVNPSITEKPGQGEQQDNCPNMETMGKVLDDAILFTVPDDLGQVENTRKVSSTLHRPSKIIGLWKAHEDGVAPKSLIRRSSLHSLGGSMHDSFRSDSHVDPHDDHDIDSDAEVRKETDSVGNSSWGDEAVRDSYSAWEILKDEYAKDFGFDYSGTESLADILNGQDASANSFKILGTSADDKSAQPHVLSPPLMDSLMSFLPDKLVNQNYWLKFSLARDGACLETLKQYCRASPNTILAIETDKGEVFGSFTSRSWRNHHGYFGGTPAFVWKMRQSRRTKCFSLFDQAQLESEIYVYMFTSDVEKLVQVCRNDTLAVGGDESGPSLDDIPDLPSAVRAAEKMGFAIALEDDLMVGTTSPSALFSSPSLVGYGDKTESFNVVNLEVWTFTPCFDLNSAERLEMHNFFIDESLHRTSENSTGSAEFSSRDFDQERFYRRVGYDTESELRRDRWTYLNMMHGGENRGIGRTPRFA